VICSGLCWNGEELKVEEEEEDDDDDEEEEEVGLKRRGAFRLAPFVRAISCCILVKGAMILGEGGVRRRGESNSDK
jgi:hypothetical protein